ncbi:TPR-like protein [Phanerochaete sordida]|uniref:TPR-like protein n=1 Tax=Phanerochaete sordida TaxID=48140 RepID=A0A9P3G1X1_9APHY|nr:TPR-like protein [Phanerochaete sordida]
MALDTHALEKSLLSGRWADDVRGPAWLTELAKNVVEGAFRDVLTSASARELFALRQSNADLSEQSLDAYFEFASSSAQTAEELECLRLVCAVALLHAFLQANWTGPNLDLKPTEILAIPGDLQDTVTDESLNAKSIVELAHGGEPAYHLAEVPFFLRLAKLLLELPFERCTSAAWWKTRAWAVHEHVLDEPAAPPEDLIPQLQSSSKNIAADADLNGRVLLEEGLFYHLLEQDRQASELFVKAAQATQLEYELTGALGKRTKFQQNDVTQLVLLAESRKRETDSAPVQDDTSATESKNLPETLQLNDDTLLERTQFVSSNPAAPGSRLTHLDPSNQPPLDPLDQCILLAMCLNIKNMSPSHGLTSEQMAPYVDRVIAHARNWSVHTMALLLRSRLEANRTRTIDRSTLQLQALVDQMPTADSSVTERLAYIHDLALPSKWELQRELAQRYFALGVVRSALEIFERLELWEDVAKSWQSLERPEKGIAVIRDLLEGRKAEADAVIARSKAASAGRRQTLDTARAAKLWALLGDLEPQHALAHYTKAWEVSGGTSGRAMRSLGGYHFARGDHAAAIVCLRKAVAINPLLSRSWFILGCAYVRTEEWAGAKEAFTRCVSIDDEDAESWNNLASVFLRMGEAGQKVEAADDAADEVRLPIASISRGRALTVAHHAQGELRTTDSAADEPSGRVPFSNKLLAFRALKQGLKFAYDNWRMWNNYMVVALDVGELAEACRALARVVEERAAKDGAAAVDEDVLERLVDAATRGEPEGEGAGAGPSRAGLLRQVTDLLERVILPRVSSVRIFRARARLLMAQGRWEDALGAHMEAYRAGAAGTLEAGETDAARWREGVKEVEEIVDVLRNFGPRAEGYKWRLQARSVLRTFMGRTRENFEDEPEWTRLTKLQEELRQEE